MWKIIKIILGIVFIVGALDNLRFVGEINQLLGNLPITLGFLAIGILLFYEAFKPVKLKTTKEE